MKTCIRCHERKKNERFDINAMSADGHINTCKRCRYAQQQAVKNKPKLDINKLLINWR